MSDIDDLGFVNREAEKALVGSLILDPEQISALEISKDDFHVRAVGEVFDAIRVLIHEKREVDYITLKDHLEKAGKLANVGGDAFLLDLITAPPSSQNAQSYAAIVIELSMRRAAFYKAQEFLRGIADKSKTVESTISEFAVQVPKLVRVKGGAEHVSKFASRHYDRIDKLSQGVDESVRYPTGILDYDSATYGGMIPKELVVLSGKPGLGKTKLMHQMAGGLAKSTVVNVYQMETDEDEIMDRDVSRLSHIPSERFIDGKLKEDEWPVYTNTINTMADADNGLYMDFTPRWSLAGLRADLIRCKAQYGTRVFMVDYLKFISDKYGKDELERLNYLSGELKIMCRELELAGLVIHVMNKEGARSNTPDITSLSQGMDIVYDADKVILLTSHIPLKGMPNPSLRTLMFLKSRRKLRFTSLDLYAFKEYPEFGPTTKEDN